MTANLPEGRKNEEDTMRVSQIDVELLKDIEAPPRGRGRPRFVPSMIQSTLSKKRKIIDISSEKSHSPPLAIECVIVNKSLKEEASGGQFGNRNDCKDDGSVRSKNQQSGLHLKENEKSATPARRVSSRHSPLVPYGTLSHTLDSSKKKLKLSPKNYSSTAKIRTKEIKKKKVEGKVKSKVKINREDQINEKIEKKSKEIKRNDGEDRNDGMEEMEFTESRRKGQKAEGPHSVKDGRPSRAAAVAAAAAIVESRKYI